MSSLERGSAIVDWTTRALVVASLGIGGWAMTTVVAHEKEITEIKANRFTSADGLEVWQAMASLKTEILTGMPPRWLIDRLDRLEDKVDALTVKFQEHNH